MSHSIWAIGATELAQKTITHTKNSEQTKWPFRSISGNFGGKVQAATEFFDKNNCPLFDGVRENFDPDYKFSTSSPEINLDTTVFEFDQHGAQIGRAHV